jgi:hypothetical protein
MKNNESHMREKRLVTLQGKRQLKEDLNNDDKVEWDQRTMKVWIIYNKNLWEIGYEGRERSYPREIDSSWLEGTMDL